MENTPDTEKQDAFELPWLVCGVIGLLGFLLLLLIIYSVRLA
jgi:hypothetical protein